MRIGIDSTEDAAEAEEMPPKAAEPGGRYTTPGRSFVETRFPLGVL